MGLGKHGFVGSTSTATLASTLTLTVNSGEYNQLLILAKHIDAGSSTMSALKVDVEVSVDVSTSDKYDVFTADDTFPFPEEVVGTAASGITDVTVNQRRYSYPSDFFNAGLPAIFLPKVPSHANILLTFTATSGGTEDTLEVLVTGAKV